MFFPPKRTRLQKPNHPRCLISIGRSRRHRRSGQGCLSCGRTTQKCDVAVFGGRNLNISAVQRVWVVSTPGKKHGNYQKSRHYHGGKDYFVAAAREQHVPNSSKKKARRGSSVPTPDTAAVIKNERLGSTRFVIFLQCQVSRHNHAKIKKTNEPVGGNVRRSSPLFHSPSRNACQGDRNAPPTKWPRETNPNLSTTKVHNHFTPTPLPSVSSPLLRKKHGKRHNRGVARHTKQVRKFLRCRQVYKLALSVAHTAKHAGNNKQLHLYLKLSTKKEQDKRVIN